MGLDSPFSRTAHRPWLHHTPRWQTNVGMFIKTTHRPATVVSVCHALVATDLSETASEATLVPTNTTTTHAKRRTNWPGLVAGHH